MVSTILEAGRDRARQSFGLNPSCCEVLRQHDVLKRVRYGIKWNCWKMKPIFSARKGLAPPQSF